MSMITRFEGAQAMAMFAVGHVSHHRSTTERSALASFEPCRVRGCLPMSRHSGCRHEQRPSTGVCNGNTAHPRFAYAIAASPISLSPIGGLVPGAPLSHPGVV